MNEGDFIEEGTLNTFGENYDFAGELFDSRMKYKILGTTIKKYNDEMFNDSKKFSKVFNYVFIR